MATNNYDILLRFLLDEASKQKTKAGVDQLTGDIGDVDKVLGAVNKDFDILEQKIKEATSPKELDSLERQLKEVENQVKDTTRAYSLQARVLRAEAAAITDDFAKARVAQIKNISATIGGVSQRGLVAGTALVGGILAEANRYAKEAEGAGKATQATREWTRATEELAAARAKVDQVLLREALPLLQQAAKVANQAADFVEKNPEIVQAALKVGVIVAGLGAIGIAVSKGIRLYADVQALLLGTQELAAAKLQDIAADKQLIAARLRAGVSGVDVPGGAARTTGAGGKLGTVALYAATVAISAELGVALGNKIGEAITKGKTGLAGPGGFGVGDAALGLVMSGQTPGFLALKGLNALGVVSDKTVGKFQETVTSLDRFLAGLLGANKILNVIQNLDAQKIKGNIEGGARGTVGGRDMLRLVGSEAETQRNDSIVKIFSDWKEDDARLIQEAADNRRKVIEQSERAIVEATRKYAQQRASINAQFNNARADIIQDFAADSQQAEIDYANERASIIRDAGEDIRQIEEDHQERIRKMTLDHNDTMASLTAERDALGLVKEQRRFDRELSEAERETNQEIAQRRRDTAIRLQELASEFAQERAQRQAKFQQDLVENEQRRQEELKQAAAAHTEEMNQLRQQKADRLREIQTGLIEEQRRRREFFLAEIRDLDSSLLGEKNLKVKYYNEMLRDADTWLAAYRAKLATAGGDTRTATTPSNTGSYPGYIPLQDAGGYMGRGLHRVAWNGIPEFAMSGRTTRAAEQIIGGRLTQDALLGALANGARGSGKSVTVNLTDARRFDRMPATWEREQMNKEMIETLEGLLS
jgi:hypothetical protein